MATGITQKNVEAEPGMGLEMQQSIASMNMSTFQGVSSYGHREGMMGMNHWEGSARYSESEGRQSRFGGAADYFDGIAVSDSFLKQYYSKVRNP